MKRPGNVIMWLVGLCLMAALAAFVLPNTGGLALSYLTILLATAVGILCIAAAITFLSRGK